MDEERIERALRAGPPDEPAWQAGAVDLRVRARGPRHRPPGALRLVLIAAALLAVAGGGLLVGGMIMRSSPPPSSDLESRVRSSGVLRVAIPNRWPESDAPGGGISGFDVDVARAIARGLGVAIDVVHPLPSEIADGHWNGRWDVALNVPAIDPRSSAVRATRPYAELPAWIAVVRWTAADRAATLDGRTICLRLQGLASAWLDGTLPDGAIDGAIPRPTNVTVLPRDEGGCLHDRVQLGWDVLIADHSLLSELHVNPAIRVLAEPAFREPVRVLADASGPDPTSLVRAIDTALDGLIADGTLRRLSEQSLAGEDVSADR